MQISWIDPEEIKRLVAQLAGPEHLPESTVWELHTQPIATPVATPHGRLLDSTDTPAPTSETVLRSSQPRVEPRLEPQNAELWRIRERLRQLRVKAQQTGIISTTPLPTEPKIEAPVATQPPIEAKEEQTPTSFELPPVETVAWATRDDLPKLNPGPETPTETNELESAPPQSPEATLPTVSAQRLESLGPMLAEAAAALAAHAKHQAQRIAQNPPTVQSNSEPPSLALPKAPIEVSPFREATPIAEEEKRDPELASQVESITVPAEAVARDGEQVSSTATETTEALATRLTLRNPRANSFENARPSSIGASPLSLRIAPHLVAPNRQPLQAEGEPLSIVEPASQPTGNKSDSAAEVEPLFGPLTPPVFKRSEPVVEAPAAAFAQQPSHAPSAPVAGVPSPPINSPSVSEDAKLESKAEAPPFRLVDLAKESSAEEVHAPSASQTLESSPPPAPSSVETLAAASLGLAVQQSSDPQPAELPKGQALAQPVDQSSTTTLPPLLPFRVPSLGLSERLAALADWACKGLATDEILLVDDYGDVLWGGQGQTALVLSAMMAWHTSQRSAPASAVVQQKRIDKPLACGRQLTVIPARTRYGVVSLAAIRDKSISDLDANRIHDALIMSVEATGLA